MRQLTRTSIALIIVLVAACAHHSTAVPTPSGGSNPTGALLEIHVMDVGQGDGILLRTPDGKNYLLDTGSAGARRKIFPYFEKLGITHLDGIIISHSHSDHAGGLAHFAGRYEIGALYSSGFFHSTGRNRKALKKLQELGVAHKALRRGDTLDLTAGVNIQILHPPKSWEGRQDQVNDFSLVFRLSYGEMDFMFTGDGEKATENTILKSKMEVRSEFLKVGHHGSVTSTSPAFLDAVSPTYAVISCGRGNSFNHPHEPTIKKLVDERHIALFRTDQQGTILVTSDGKTIEIRALGISEAEKNYRKKAQKRSPQSRNKSKTRGPTPEAKGTVDVPHPEFLPVTVGWTSLSLPSGVSVVLSGARGNSVVVRVSSAGTSIGATTSASAMRSVG